METNKRLVVVVGATGTQGRPIVQALLANGGYRVRALMRNAVDPIASALSAQGAELVVADLNFSNTLFDAFRGAYAVYGLTPTLSGEDESRQGRSIVDACWLNQVPLLIWSSYPHATTISNGRYPDVRHFDRKAEIEAYIKQMQQPAVILHLGRFVDNLVTNNMFHVSYSDPSSYHIFYPIVRPEVPVPRIWASGGDLGRAVRAIVDNWADPWQQVRLTAAPITLCSFWISGNGMARTIERLTGKQVSYVRLTDIANPEQEQMFRMLDEGILYAGTVFPPSLLLEMGVRFSTFEDFVREAIMPITSGTQ